jgi:hypothetical protein
MTRAARMIPILFELHGRRLPIPPRKHGGGDFSTAAKVPSNMVNAVLTRWARFRDIAGTSSKTVMLPAT